MNPIHNKMNDKFLGFPKFLHAHQDEEKKNIANSQNLQVNNFNYTRFLLFKSLIL